jgi:hypothetical protein
MATLYLLFSLQGELAGLERGLPRDESDARVEAARLLSRDRDVEAVEIWTGGRLLGAVRG